MKTDKKTFDKRKKIIKDIDTIRRAKKITQETVGKGAEIARENVSKFFRGSICPTLDTVIRVCDAVGCEIKVFNGGYLE